MKEKKLVNLRALLILIVVFGHSIILYSKSFTMFQTIYKVNFLSVLKLNAINAYQMQLFFSLSGYLFYYTCQKHKKYLEFVIDKAKRLLIPFISVVVLYMAPIKMLLNVPGFKEGDYFYNCYDILIKLNNAGHLWFLISLFIIFIIFFTLSKIIKIEKKETKYIIVDIVILLITLLISRNVSIIKDIIPKTSIYRAFTYLFWFYLGFCINKYLALGKEDEAYKKWFIPYLCLMTGALVVFRLTHTRAIVQLVAALCVVVCLYYIIPSKTNKVTEYLDRNSMGMFLFHSPLIYISFTLYPNIHPALMVLINFFGFGFLSSLITELIRKTPLRIIIGEYKKNK
jgi:fucose 4-O-acetylase-like acetyltransferase